MPIFLEVIVTSATEAIAAEQGGADRLELVRDLDSGGLTPSIETAKEVLAAVSIPLRVMVREADSMTVGQSSEKAGLRRSLDAFSRLQVDGLVFGYLKARQIDTDTLADLLSEPLPCGVTFHRAFDEVADPTKALTTLKLFPQIDRVLTRAGEGSWAERRARLDEFQAASPGIQMLFAVGRDTTRLGELQHAESLYEVHVGRAARTGHVNSGAVSSVLVAELKNSSSASGALATSPDRAAGGVLQ